MLQFYCLEGYNSSIYYKLGFLCVPELVKKNTQLSIWIVSYLTDISIEAEGPPCDKSHQPKKTVPTKPENKPGTLKFLSEEEHLKVKKILSCYSKEDGKEVGVQTDHEVVPEGSDNTRLKTCFLGKGVQTEPLDYKSHVEKTLDILE